MKKDNRGMSLVEIMIVVAIMAIATGVIGYNVSLSANKRVTECTQKIATAIQHARTVSMGKQQTMVTITTNAKGEVVVREIVNKTNADGTASGEVVSEDVVGVQGLTVQCATNGVDITSGSPLTLEFNRTNGSLKETRIGADVKSPCQQILVTNGSVTKKIDIVPLTGKVSYER